MKPGAFLSGLPVFLRSRREDHGLNGYVWAIVWVLGPELPGLTGGRFALGSKAKGQGGDGAPPRGRRPMVVDGRTWAMDLERRVERMDVERMDRADGRRMGVKRENSSTGPGLLAPDPLTALRAPAFQAPDSYTRETGCGAAAQSPTGPLVSRGTASLSASGGVGFRRALRRSGVL